MILGYHAISSAYGFWLPNEQRGSWSTEVWAPHLQQFGPATKTEERRSLARQPFDRSRRREMRESLKFPAVQFDAAQIRAIGVGFGEIALRFKMIVHACAIMPDHFHCVFGQHETTAEYLMGVLKRAGTRQLNAANLHPLAGHQRVNGATPSPWTDGGWVRFLNSDEAVFDAIDYVEKNPIKIGMQKQDWNFVRKYEPRS